MGYLCGVKCMGNCGWGTTDHARFAAPWPRLLALLRPAPGLIQELAGFCMNMHAVLLECRAGSTSRHRGKTRLPSTLCRPAARAPEAETGSRTKMAPGMDSKKTTKASRRPGRPLLRHRGRRWRWDPWHVGLASMAMKAPPHPSKPQTSLLLRRRALRLCGLLASLPYTRHVLYML